MAECDWAILCDHAFPDINRKMCLIGIFDRVATAAVPTALHQSALALKLVGDPNERVNLQVRVIRPNGPILADIAVEVVLNDTTGTAEIQLGMAGLPLPDEGDYAFEIIVNGTLAKAVVISVKVARPTKS
jgi:hypothetical protein